MPNLVSKLTVQLIDQFSGPAKGAAKSGLNLADVLKNLEKSSGKGFGKFQKTTQQVVKDLTALEAIGNFKNLKRGLSDASLAYRRAAQEANRMAAAITASGTATKAQEAALKRAQNEVARTKAAFMAQGQAVRSSMSSLNAAGVRINSLATAEARLKANIEGANRALAQQAARAATVARRKEALGYAGAAAGVYAGQKAKEIGGKAISSAAEFDIGVRKQRVFTDIEAGDQKALIAQALRVGQQSPYTNLDVVKAQTAAMQGLPASFSSQLRAEVGEGIIENVKNYAMVMEADLETSAQAIRSYLQAAGKDISTKEKALAEANKATNQLVRMAKLGGMSDEDVQQFLKFAVGSGTAAGLTPESQMAIAALARRGGLRGDEAGVFMRSTAAKLVSPTKGGISALGAAGIDYSKFVKMPDQLDTGRFEQHMKRSLGTGFTDATRAKMSEVLANKELTGDQGKFVEAIVSAMEGQSPKTRSGTMQPAHKQALAKAARAFHKISAETVDAEALLDAVMSSSMTLAQLNAFLTDKHGGKGAITQKQRDEYNEVRKKLKESGNDPDFAKKKADEIYGGLGGAVKQLQGSIETFYQQLGTSNEVWLKPLITSTGNLIDSFSNLSAMTHQIVTAFGILGAAAGGIYGSMKFAGALLGVGGPAVALNGSAAALAQSAVALNAAAVRLGAGGSIPGGPGGAPGDSTAKGGFWSRVGRIGGMIGRAGLWGGVGYGIYQGGKVIGDANRAGYANVQPGQQHDTGRMMRRRANQALYDSHRVPVINQTGAKAEDRDDRAISIDTSALKKAKTEADETKKAVAGVAEPVSVQVDNSKLAETLRLAQQVKETLLGIGGIARGLGGSISRTYADFGVKE